MNLMWWCTLPQPQISSCPAPPLLEFGISLGLPFRIRLTSREPGLTKQVEDDLRGLWPSGLVYTLVHGYYKNTGSPCWFTGVLLGSPRKRTLWTCLVEAFGESVP